MELNYCDRCGAHGKVRVVLPSGNDLVFCGHHGYTYMDGLRDYQLINLTEDDSLHLATV